MGDTTVGELCPDATSEQNRTSLVAVAAHELRHPLHLMRLALARYFTPNDPGRVALERYIDRMARVIGDLADMVRVEQDALDLQIAWLDITQLLREVVDAYLPDAANRRVRLTLEGATVSQWIRGDEQRVLQVMSNVLDNALKFTPVGGRIVVAMNAGPPAVEIRVSDTGNGIAPELLPHVFDLFAHRGARGLGIGLAVARRIVELHGGSIGLSSAGLGRGTEVTITLPQPMNP